MAEVFSKVKSTLFLRKVAPRSREALVEAVGLLPPVPSLLGTRKDPSITVATANWVNFYGQRCNTMWYCNRWEKRR